MLRRTVVDDFYRDPLAVREQVLKQSFVPPHPTGRGGPAWRCELEFSDEVLARLQNCWGRPIEPLKFEARYNLASALPMRSRSGVNFCHSDYGLSECTAVIYLSLPAHCRGGTSFFRHRPTNSLSYHPILGRLDYADTDSWELVESVEMAFNRMVTYRSKDFHGIQRPFFGTALEDARLIQSVRFNLA